MPTERESLMQIQLIRGTVTGPHSTTAGVAATYPSLPVTPDSRGKNSIEKTCYGSSLLPSQIRATVEH